MVHRNEKQEEASLFFLWPCSLSLEPLRVSWKSRNVLCFFSIIMKNIEGVSDPGDSNSVGTSCHLVIIFMLFDTCSDKDSAFYLFCEFNFPLKHIHFIDRGYKILKPLYLWADSIHFQPYLANQRILNFLY